jgi:hypothetical protein
MKIATRANEIIQKRLNIEARELFARIAAARAALRGMLAVYLKNVNAIIEAKAHDTSNLRRINKAIHEETVALRASMRIWINAAIRDAAKMGFRHIGDAITPIFKHSLKEQLEREIIADRALYEAKLVFSVKKNLATASLATVALSSPKWADTTGRIIRNVTKKNLVGLNPSERIWDLTNRTEQDLKRMVANGMAAGENPTVIARKITKYVSPTIQDNLALGIQPGPGVYRSPYRNAYRLAKTEMNRTYVQAGVAFAKDKAWVDGMDIVLSPVHDDYDECDDLAAGGPYTADEVGDLIPAHPHCGCRGVPRINPAYLGEEEAA